VESSLRASRQRSMQHGGHGYTNIDGHGVHAVWLQRRARTRLSKPEGKGVSVDSSVAPAGLSPDAARGTCVTAPRRCTAAPKPATLFDMAAPATHAHTPAVGEPTLRPRASTHPLWLSSALRTPNHGLTPLPQYPCGSSPCARRPCTGVTNIRQARLNVEHGSPR
jgi:hypothetical protein